MSFSDFSWLPNSLLKGVSLPTIEIVENLDYSALYYSETGHIVVCYDPSSAFFASSIVHELCHHIQHCNGRSADQRSYVTWDYLYGTLGLSYEDSIRFFYLMNPTEMEALLFENKYALNDISEYQLRKLVFRE